jgi:hypothetical protein
MNKLLRTTRSLGVILFFFSGGKGEGQQGRLYPGNKIMMVSIDQL